MRGIYTYDVLLSTKGLVRPLIGIIRVALTAVGGLAIGRLSDLVDQTRIYAHTACDLPIVGW